MYCMKCGQKILEDSTFCQYCGNKIPKMVEEEDERVETTTTYVYGSETINKEDKTSFWRATSILLIIAVIALGVYVSRLNDAIEERINEIIVMDANYSALEVELYNKKREYDDIKKSQESLESLYAEVVTYKWFMDECIAIVPDDGSKKYHKYKCDEYESGSSFWAFNTEAAISRGYKACDKCYKK